MLLRVVDDGVFRDIRIEEGEMFLLPGKFRLARIDLVADLRGKETHLTTLCDSPTRLVS